MVQVSGSGTNPSTNLNASLAWNRAHTFHMLGAHISSFLSFLVCSHPPHQSLSLEKPPSEEQSYPGLQWQCGSVFLCVPAGCGHGWVPERPLRWEQPRIFPGTRFWMREWMLLLRSRRRILKDHLTSSQGNGEVAGASLLTPEPIAIS